jgi:hypothetical protein
MKKNNVIKVAAAIGAITLMAGGVVVADAAMGRSFNKENFKGSSLGSENKQFMFGLSEEEREVRLAEVSARRLANQEEMSVRREAILAALNSGDYEAWKLAVGENHPFVNQITADNFLQFASAHQDMDSLQEKLAEMSLERNAPAGFGKKMGVGRGNGHGQGQGNGQGQGHGRFMQFNQ